MALKEKFLNKSKSYIYYKNSHVSLTNENKKLHNQLSAKDYEINKLKNQLQSKENKIHELENHLIHNENGFIFSIIIAIFNTENYLSSESVLPSNHLIFCHPLLLLPLIFPSTRVFSNESVLWIKELELQLQHQSFQWIFRTNFL